MIGSPRVAVVMPAYNAARTLRATHAAIPATVDRVILVDDGSRDATAEIATTLGISVIRHPVNRGYGANQKTCYDEALRGGADVVVMLHPDGQYEPGLIPELVRPIATGDAAVVLGSRMLEPGAARAGGMPVWKRAGNRFLTAIENRALGTRLAELHTGYRAFSAAFLRGVPYHANANGFVFDTQILVQAVAGGYPIIEIPAQSRYFEEASSVGFGVSVRYGIETIATMAVYRAWRLGASAPAFLADFPR